MQQPPSQHSPTHESGDTTDELRGDARKLGSTAADRIHSEVDSRKSTAADQAKSVSSAMDRAAGEMGDDTPNWLKSAFRQGADQVQRFADTIEQKDSRQMLSEVQDFARQRPGTFLAACAAAGFAASRIFKAGADDQHGSGQYGQDQQWRRNQQNQDLGRDQDQAWGDGERAFEGSRSGQQFGESPQRGEQTGFAGSTRNARKGEFV